jgi:hypothetical protein
LGEQQGDGKLRFILLRGAATEIAESPQALDGRSEIANPKSRIDRRAIARQPI